MASQIMYSDYEAMSLAIEEAYKGAAGVSPNPLVGCVVLDSKGHLLSVGHHEKYGGPHAEVNALNNLTSAQLQGAQVFVTLEPCAHEGKTPSCAKMLAKLPIRRVVYGLVDPNPLVRGQGAEILNNAGIQTEVFPHLQKELEAVCESFLWNFRKQKIFVALKLASSLDGIVALESGESRWITNEKSRKHVHFLRACYDAVLVGSQTVSLDDPSLNIRHPDIHKENKVVVLDTEGELLKKIKQLKIFQAHRSENIFWCVAEDAHFFSENPQNVLADLEKTGIHLVRVKRGLRFLNLSSVLDELWKLGLRSVLIEGGAQIASSFLELGLVNRMFLFQAPILLGQKGGRFWTSTIKVEDMSTRFQLADVKYMIFDDNILTTGVFLKTQKSSV